VQPSQSLTPPYVVRILSPRGCVQAD
jgi:hypothetical protein